MRDIKFRAWDKPGKPYMGGLTKGEMLYDDELPQGSQGYGESITVNFMFTQRQQDHGGHVYMQYTGLKDKNGKEIYDGDITSDGKGEVFKIIWHDKDPGPMWGASVIKHPKKDLWVYGDINFALRKHKVIGNIFENPELLEAQT